MRNGKFHGICRLGGVAPCGASSIYQMLDLALECGETAWSVSVFGTRRVDQDLGAAGLKGEWIRIAQILHDGSRIRPSFARAIRWFNSVNTNQLVILDLNRERIRFRRVAAGSILG